MKNRIKILWVDNIGKFAHRNAVVAVFYHDDTRMSFSVREHRLYVIISRWHDNHIHWEGNMGQLLEKLLRKNRDSL